MKVLGFDPGSKKLGYGLIERAGTRLLWLGSGTVRLHAGSPLPERLRAAYDAAAALIAEHSPDMIVVEECFVAKSAKAALVLGHVRGVLLLAACQAGIPSREFAPRSVKLAAVGAGGAAKEQVQYMVPRLLDGCPPALDEDEADALAVAWCGAIHDSGPMA